MAHIVLDLSLPSVLSSFFFAIFKFLLRTHHALHVVHASRLITTRYTCTPIRNPIRSTSSFAVSITVRSSTRIHFAFRDHEGEHYITWLFRMTILRLMCRTCMYRILHAPNTSTSRTHQAIFTISCCRRNYLKTLRHLFSFCCCNLKLSIHQGR